MDKKIIEQIKKEKLPEHIAIIMDGNRRWANKNKIRPWKGHEEGVKALKKLLEFQKSDSAVPIKIITLYSLSEDNRKKRTKQEYQQLMMIFKIGFEEIVKDRYIYDNKVKISVFGDYKKLPAQVSNAIQNAIDKTKNHNKFYLNFCINYDGQTEMVEAFKKIIKDSSYKSANQNITKEMIKQNIYTSQFPAPELIIRSGGEKRLSGFLLWDSSYSELYFTEKLWPEITEDDILEGIRKFQESERKFGK
jgi:tritrans,polycis-undecaprenyl-diphosphate synthase [geranylgeranyl-diphosphate specific]